MFIEFNDYRVSLVQLEGDTGFKTSVYKGSKKVGVASRKDGLTLISDIKVEFFNTIVEKELRKITINKKRISIDNEEQLWTNGLIIYSLMENKAIYENIKKALMNNKMIVKFKKDDYFSVVNGMKNTPEAIQILKRKEGYEIDMTGNELVRLYEKMRQS